jgi:hypothetical protein
VGSASCPNTTPHLEVGGPPTLVVGHYGDTWLGRPRRTLAIDLLRTPSASSQGDQETSE